MNPRYDLQLMVKVSQMYYNSGLKQEEIARELEISRSSISMILAEARDFGIIEINIKNPVKNHDQLSAYLKSKFQLMDAIVIPTTLKNPRLLLKLAAERAADYVRQDIHEGSTLGIAWGSTCFEFMSSFKTMNSAKDIQIVPLIGGTNQVRSEYQLNEMVRIFAEKVNGAPAFIYAPAIPDTKMDHDLYMKSSDMQSVIQLWKDVDIAVISIGAPPEYYGAEESYLLPDVSCFKRDMERPIGDICARHFNFQGDFLENEYNHKIIGIETEQLKATKKVICVATGDHKIYSIIGALRTGLIDVFVSDELTIQKVMNYLEDEK